MKKLILFLAVACQSIGLLAGGWAPYFDTDRAAFDGGLSIKLAAQGGLCGRIVLKPKILTAQTKDWIFEQRGIRDQVIDGIYVQSVLWKVDPFTLKGQVTNDAQATSDIDGALVGPLQTTGLWQRYDWAGSNWQDHYKISCFIKIKPLNARSPNDFTFQRVPCDWVVNFNEDGKHNVGCVVGPAGPDASYEPLNMNKG